MKQSILAAIRAVGLIRAADELRYRLTRRSKARSNVAFKSANVTVALPHDRLLYETSSAVDYAGYYGSGKAWADRFAALIDAHMPAASKVAEWGCGVGRIIRHMPYEMTGMDYDPRMIDWCSKHLGGTYVRNDLMPPAPVADAAFDAVYCLSVFTHLSEAAHSAWFAEMRRIIRPGGLFLFTTMSDGCRLRLLPSEQRDYDEGKLVIRADSREGGRTFAAYESGRYVREVLTKGCEIVAHEPAPQGVVDQDLWVVRL